ncbi:MAG: hypothetical protein VXY93_12460, partial [Pseudomonadota bacterium]|nr:hypothetical protein [Pseudomonadota bacterium]
NDTRADIVFRTIEAQSAPIERLRIASTGRVLVASGNKVGIGTDNPNRQMTIVDAAGGGIGVIGSNAGIYLGTHHTGGFQVNAAIARAAANNYHISGSAVGDLCIAGESTADIIIGTSAHAGAMDERIRIQSDGKIGIFDSSPVSKVTINNGTGDSQFVQLKNDNVGIFFGTYGTGHASYPREATINGSRTDSGSSPFLRIAGQGGIKFCVDLNSERLRITSDGHTIPGADVTYDLGANTNNRWRNIYGQTLSLTSYATIGAIVANDPGSSYYAYNNRIGGGLAVTGTTRLFGNVGIGTDNPTDILDINSDSASAVTNMYLRNHANLGGAALNLFTQGT